jgi:xanthine/CO dehydrogenase XdhC/CoxF family maturation factor
MKEIISIIKAFDETIKTGKRSALATVVHVEGSSYRRPGARMLVTEDGMLTGAISGGCLEGDALRKALNAIAQQENKLVTYDTTDEDDAKFGVQLGCNGIVHILFEPIKDEHNSPISLLKALVQQRTDAVLVTMFSLQHSDQPGTCMLYREDQSLSTSNISYPVTLKADVMRVLQNRTSQLTEYTVDEKLFSVFIEFKSPPVKIIVAGAGNDVQPLIELTDVLGWESIVMDGRPAQAAFQRFPKATQVIVAKAEEVLSKISFDEQTAFLLMTHNYNYDLALLGELIKKEVSYIGILGPKKKLGRMLDELKEQGINPSENQLSKIHGPVGLDLGAETAEEIALSIVAEIKAVFAGRKAAFLKEKQQAIHD